MNRSDVQRIAADLIRAGTLLELHGDRVWNLTRDWATPLNAAGGGPTGKGNISRPTEKAGMDMAEGKVDPSMGYHATLIETCDKAHPLALALRDLIVTVTHEAQPEGRRTTLVDCCNCGEPALPRPKSGRCAPCYEHKRRTGSDRKIEAA